MVRFFVDLDRELAEPLKIPRRALVKRSTCSLIAAARFSWRGVRCKRSMINQLHPEHTKHKAKGGSEIANRENSRCCG